MFQPDALAIFRAKISPEEATFSTEDNYNIWSKRR